MAFRRQFDGVAEMPAGKSRIAEFLQREPSQSDVSPEIVVASLECVAKRVACLLGVSGVPEFQTLPIIGLRLLHAAGVDQLELILAALHTDQGNGTRPGPTAARARSLSTTPARGPFAATVAISH